MSTDTPKVEPYTAGEVDLIRQEIPHLVQPERSTLRWLATHASLLAENEELRREREWISVEDRLPEGNVPVIAFVSAERNGKVWTRRIRAQYAAPNTLMLSPDCDDDAGTYDEATDTYYVGEGWYEDNEYEETHWRVSDPVTHWMPLPSSPTNTETE